MHAQHANSDRAVTAADDQAANQPDNKVRVLLVDDDPSYRVLCQRFLRRDSSREYAFTLANSAREAMDACLNNGFDCLLIDYYLPDSTGTDALYQLRDVFGDKLAPAVIMTAEGGEEAATRAVRAGAADFLSKRDVNERSLSRTVHNAVDKGVLRQSVRQRTEELAEANEVLRRRNREIKRFYHTISHEVKTPLTAIREFISLVQDGVAGPVTDDQTELLSHALASCDQIASQFNDMLDMTRFESGKLTLNLKQAALDPVFSRSTAAIAEAVREKRIRLEVKLDKDLPTLLIDEDRLVQVVSNLLNNAVKFTPDEGLIELWARRGEDADTVTLCVRDSGCGIDKEHLVHIFDRLYQAGSQDSRTIAGGLGLGLSIAREIVRLHGGELRVDSEPGVGSCFCLNLHTSAAAVAAASDEQDSNPHSPEQQEETGS